MEKFSKYWTIIVAVGGVLLGVAGWLYNQGATSKSLEGRTFDSPEQKVEVVKYVKDAPSPKELQMQYILDSIDAVNRITSRRLRDSLMIVETKARRHTDSINLLNADQIYQTKQELKDIKDALNELKNNNN